MLKFIRFAPLSAMLCVTLFPATAAHAQDSAVPVHAQTAVAVSPNSQAAAAVPDDIQADAKSAVDIVNRAYTINPLAKLDDTHAPLSATGSWGAGQIKPQFCPDSTCMRVLYRVPEQHIVCSWVVHFIPSQSGVNGKFVVLPVITDEDDNARRYTMKRQWMKGDVYPTPAPDNPRIVYPAIARSAHMGGRVVADVLLDDTGSVKQVIIQSGAPLLRPEVLATVSQWHYMPATLNGKPLASRITLSFGFELYGNGVVEQIGMDGTEYGSSAAGAHEGTLTGSPSSRPAPAALPNQMLRQPGPPQ